MCVISMVHDYYWKRLPKQQQNTDLIDLSELRKLMDDFKAATEAAKIVDKLTGQPDCIDPEKAKLQERVAELERKLAAVTEAVNG
jgi:hypothetical protein